MDHPHTDPYMAGRDVGPAKLASSFLRKNDMFCVKELVFELPLDHHSPQESIKLNARIYYRVKSDPSETRNETHGIVCKPIMVYLVGGPGSDNPATREKALVQALVGKGYQVLCLDYRGTGKSHRVNAATLGQMGDAQQQADYLAMFRQDNIVRDLEAIRLCLMGMLYEEGQLAIDQDRWSLISQSYGGWVALTYLSWYSRGLKEVFLAGAVAPVAKTAEEVYTATYRKVMEYNRSYYSKYPEDKASVLAIAKHIGSQPDCGIPIPRGGLLTVQRFMGIGRALGAPTGLHQVHTMVTRMKEELEGAKTLSEETLASIGKKVPFDQRPLYALLHEPIYADGSVPGWAAQRIGASLEQFRWLRQDFSGFAAGETPYFSGEMVYPFVFEVYAQLQGLGDVADILARKKWTSLYDEAQLRQNAVPVYALAYEKDMYVDAGLTRETASMVRNMEVVYSTELYHSALKDNTDEVLAILFGMRPSGH